MNRNLSVLARAMGYICAFCIIVPIVFAIGVSCYEGSRPVEQLFAEWEQDIGFKSEVSNNDEETAWKCPNCDLLWELSYGTPLDNQMNYCPKCGCKMTGQKFIERDCF